MTKIDENIQTAEKMLAGIVERCYELEEENKKLKEELEQYKKGIPTIRIDKDGNVVDENGDRTYNSGVFHYAN